MSHPAGLPDLFLDRSLGRLKVPGLLRDAGLRLTMLSEHYGVPGDETVPDEEWLELAGSRGWAVLMKDKRIRYRPHEREAIERFRVCCFCLAGRNLRPRRWLSSSCAVCPLSQEPAKSLVRFSTSSSGIASRRFNWARGDSGGRTSPVLTSDDVASIEHSVRTESGMSGLHCDCPTWRESRND